MHPTHVVNTSLVLTLLIFSYTSKPEIAAPGRRVKQAEKLKALPRPQPCARTKNPPGVLGTGRAKGAPERQHPWRGQVTCEGLGHLPAPLLGLTLRAPGREWQGQRPVEDMGRTRA